MELRNFIDGKFINSLSKKNIAVLNPANQKIVGNIDEALDEEIDLAFQAAKRAFDKRILLDMDAKDKSNMMRAIAQKLRERKEEGGKLLSQENGKTIKQCIYAIWLIPKYIIRKLLRMYEDILLVCTNT